MKRSRLGSAVDVRELIHRRLSPLLAGLSTRKELVIEAQNQLPKTFPFCIEQLSPLVLTE